MAWLNNCIKNSLGAHLHAATMVLPGFHKPNEIKLDNMVNSRYNPSIKANKSTRLVEDISQQANIPKQLQQPPQPTKQEQEQAEQRRIIHIPHGSWCPICVKAKGQSIHHRRGGLKEQSLIQLGKRTNQQEVASTHNLDSRGNIAWSLHGNTDIAERPAIIQLAQEAAKGSKGADNPVATIFLTYPSGTRITGSIERFHQTLFTPDNVPETFFPGSTAMTSFQCRWGVQCNSGICNFGEVVLADIKPMTVNKLDIRNNEQKTEGIWLGKTTNGGEHIIAWDCHEGQFRQGLLLHPEFDKVDIKVTMGQEGL
eukprot:296923-Amphidinium_carterae.2